MSTMLGKSALTIGSEMWYMTDVFCDVILRLSKAGETWAVFQIQLLELNLSNF